MAAFHIKQRVDDGFLGLGGRRAGIVHMQANGHSPRNSVAKSIEPLNSLYDVL